MAGVWGHTRTTLREMIAQAFDMHQDTATGGTTGTLVDSKLVRFADDYWIGAQAFIKTDAGGAGAAPQGESSWVTDFAASTGTLTCSPAFTVAPATGDTYQLYRVSTKAQIDTALQHVCAGGEVASSLTPSTTQLDYDLTCLPGLWRRVQLLGVWRRELADLQLQPYEIRGWQLEDAEGQLTLRLPYLLNGSDQLWVTYITGELYVPAADTDRVNLPAALVRARAVVWLVENKLASFNGPDLDLWGQRLRYWREQLQREERRYQAASRKALRHVWSRGETIPRAEAALGLRAHFGGDFSNWP